MPPSWSDEPLENWVEIQTPQEDVSLKAYSKKYFESPENKWAKAEFKIINWAEIKETVKEYPSYKNFEESYLTTYLENSKGGKTGSLDKVVGLASAPGGGIPGITDSYWAHRNGKLVKVSKYKTPNPADPNAGTPKLNTGSATTHVAADVPSDATPVGSGGKHVGYIKSSGTSGKVHAWNYKGQELVGEFDKAEAKTLLATIFKSQQTYKNKKAPEHPPVKYVEKMAAQAAKEASPVEALFPPVGSQVTEMATLKSLPIGSVVEHHFKGSTNTWKKIDADIWESDGFKIKSVDLKESMDAGELSLKTIGTKSLIPDEPKKVDAPKAPSVSKPEPKKETPKAEAPKVEAPDKKAESAPAPEKKAEPAPAPEKKAAPAPEFKKETTKTEAPASPAGKVKIGGKEFSADDVKDAISILEKAKGIMVKQPLQKYNNPVWDVDYKALAKEHVPGTNETKPAFIKYLKDQLGKTGDAKKVDAPAPEPKAEPTKVEKIAETAAKPKVEAPKPVDVASFKPGQKLTPEEVKALPIGAKIAFNYAPNHIYEKNAADEWQTPTGVLLGNTVFTAVPSAVSLHSLPGGEKVEEPKVEAPKPAKPGPVTSLTDFMSLPVGTKVTYTSAIISAGPKEFTKTENGWTSPSHSSPLPDSAFAGAIKLGKVAVTGKVEATEVKKVEPTPAPEKVGPKPGDKLTKETFASLPAGAVVANKYSQYKKGPNGGWSNAASAVPQFKISDSAFDNTIANGNLTLHSLPSDAPAPKASPSVGQALTKDDLDALPNGSVVKDPEGISWTKNNKSEWNLSKYVNQISGLPSSSIADHKLTLVSAAPKPGDKLTQETPKAETSKVEAPKPAAPSANAVNWAPVIEGKDFHNLVKSYYSTATELRDTIKEMAAHLGLAGVIGQHMTGTSDRKAWIEAVYKGDLVKAYQIEEAAAKAKGKVHAKAKKHPGAPGNSGNIEVAPAVAGELKAGSPLSGPGVPENLKAALLDTYPSNETVDAVLLAAGMKNSQGLSASNKRAWARWFAEGYQIGVDRLSLYAKKNVEDGNFYSEPIVPPKPIVGAGESVEIDPEWKSFNIGLNRATNLTPAQLNAYLAQIFTPDTRKAVTTKLSVDQKQAIVQLHYLSTLPKLKGAHKDPEVAASEFNAIKKQIAEQAPGYSNAGWNSENWQFDLPAFPAKNSTFEIEPASAGVAKLGGTQSKFFVLDDEGNRWLFKPFAESWRSKVSHGAHMAGKFFGFTHATSQTVTIDGKFGHLQSVLDASDIGPASSLTDSQLADVAREHLFDWLTGNDDAHKANFMVLPSGKVVGIDKDRAWGPGFGKYALKPGALSHQSHVYYEDLYADVMSGKISAGQAQALYKAVMSRAKMMQARPDDGYRAILEEAFSGDGYPLSGASRSALIEKALARKNSLVDDFEELWSGILAKAGVEKPEPSTQIAPHIHTGATGELFEDVEKAGAVGHSTFYHSTDLEDSHFILQSVKTPQGKLLVGQGQLLESGDAKLSKFLASKFTGVTLGASAPKEPVAYTKFTQAAENLAQQVLLGVKTISHHAKDGQYNTSSVGAMELAEKTIKADLDLLKTDEPTFISTHNLKNEPELVGEYRAMYENYLSWIEKAKSAKANGVMVEGMFSAYKVKTTPKKPEAETVTLKNDITVQKRETKVLGGEHQKGELVANKHDDDDLSGGQSGYEYLVTLPSGTRFTYQPFDDTFGVYTSQKGRFRFTSTDASNTGVVTEIEDLLRQAGVHLEEADESTLEAHYWRHLYSVMKNRQSSDKTKKVEAAFKTHKPDSADSVGEEVTRWRAVWSEYEGSEKVDSFVGRQGYLPKLRSYAFDSEGKHGRPVWERFDADAKALYEKGNPLIHGLGSNGGAAAAAYSGGLLSTDERPRVLGKWITGMSSSQDQSYGSANFVFTRQNHQGAQYMMLDPMAGAATTTYAYTDDNYGNIKSRKGYAPFDFSEQTAFTGGSNEMMIKYGISFVDHLLLLVMDEPERSQVIEYYKNKGVYKIRGVDVEDVFVTHKDAAKAGQAVRDRMKSGWYLNH
jgi:hypothetical protein